MGKNLLLNKLRGFQKSPRGRFLWLTRRQLTQEELILYELGVAITDWDKSHIETYGSFKATDQELSEILGWKSDTTAGKHRNSLINKKIFRVRTDGRFEAWGFEKWELRKSSQKPEVNAKTEDQDAKLQDGDAKIEEKQLQSVDYSLGSSKGSVSIIENLDYISDEELSRISKEIDNQELLKSAPLSQNLRSNLDN